MKKNKLKKYSIALLPILIIFVIEYYNIDINNIIGNTTATSETTVSSLEEIPEYSNKSYVIINDNEPYFKEEEKNTTTFEKYGELDNLGRCTTAYANIDKSMMPTEKRGSIGGIKPSGWHTVKYDIVEGKYLYNRCHLIGYQLTGENANEKNLITCTRSMNTVGMLEFENKVAKYIKETNNHVLYRVTPIFEGNNLLATGVEMEAYSIEDNGKGFDSGQKTAHHKSLAMTITKERLVNYTKNQDFVVHTDNILDQDTKVVGAKVSFEIPYIYEN